jgi:hypothetical protein
VFDLSAERRIPGTVKLHPSVVAGRKDTPAIQSFIFSQPTGVARCNTRDRAGFEGATSLLGNAALNPYKQAIVLHGRVIISPLVRYGILAM